MGSAAMGCRLLGSMGETAQQRAITLNLNLIRRAVIAVDPRFSSSQAPRTKGPGKHDLDVLVKETLLCHYA